MFLWMIYETFHCYNLPEIPVREKRGSFAPIWCCENRKRFDEIPSYSLGKKIVSWMMHHLWPKFSDVLNLFSKVIYNECQGDCFNFFNFFTKFKKCLNDLLFHTIVSKFPGKSIIFGKVRNLCSLLAIGTRCIFGNGEKKA